ncbi:hypothetical protein M406DRAFT_74119 [Cryphonectria parasitica EP155]|uniref:Uncharacterized protein n=1 Tax=Cryphonectria parasitica (strain ATCC 38755 / EP155) TaxID=660469 RepID=A0A9P4XYA3_CRYP1|nr:uncharacterized protein M406DRAFT_74119 [Cryphonectria parasitica EP155]KAF3763524.1 hypothetical protein M406DRAFT_74119 [Cryphonectria parasitica EP155]
MGCEVHERQENTILVLIGKNFKSCKLRRIANHLEDLQAEVILLRQQNASLKAQNEAISKTRKRKKIPNPNKRFMIISEALTAGEEANTAQEEKDLPAENILEVQDEVDEEDSEDDNADIPREDSLSVRTSSGRASSIVRGISHFSVRRVRVSGKGGSDNLRSSSVRSPGAGEAVCGCDGHENWTLRRKCSYASVCNRLVARIDNATEERGHDDRNDLTECRRRRSRDVMLGDHLSELAGTERTAFMVKELARPRKQRKPGWLDKRPKS